MKWLELCVEADVEAIDSVSELFSRYGHGGVSIEQPLDPDAGEFPTTVDSSKPAIVKTYLPLDEKAPETQRQLERELWYLGLLRRISPLQVREISEEDWSQAWKEHFNVHRVGRRIVIRPSWREYTPLPDDIVVELDPGMAFGTGLHPTTQMCLQTLEKYMQPGWTVLDLGTGSGILAIAAARLGARHVLAVDTDPVAVEAAAANIASNGVQDVVKISAGSVDAATAGNGSKRPSPSDSALFDLIVENIVADVILSLAIPVAKSLTAGGVLIAGGILDTRLPEVEARLRQVGLAMQEILEQGDWRTVVARKPAQNEGS
ncbi:MAG: 50S ribosomal protein L11 methyltransferase [Chloroflexota bacterium]|nr:MAG: 50S ribosomal protein L11 methyltransferase [Chloroflexota bacterium]